MLKIGMENKSIIGLKIANQCFISCLLFLDDVFLFGLGLVEDWRNYKFILVLFSSNLGMMMSEQKSFCISGNLSMDMVEALKSIFPYKFIPLDQGFKYLGYFLKENDYRILD